ncbi:hypothetical protein JR316_0005908 [Psilocybe cubensis]|uniref:Uncharacterized protein n=2 Tax=Psilocybe cubensis TaxID=181762 RepID=A0A8H7Y381_PSICU|nr:hypothetical protein JR316_0005908 [Psilocybe cubensis]KAH9481383.1 hypothetical protein JR316_0005908 [Psilocybe cubensis]
MTTLSSTTFELDSPPVDESVNDPLYNERFDAFLQKSLADIKAFADRELRSYDETRRRVAEWHAKHLFPQSPSSLASGKSPPQVRSILCDASHILESLSAVSNTQSFLLAINPSDPSDQGFLGGSVVGREFWRGLRGGGVQGAKAFKVYCANLISQAEASQNPSNAGKSERNVSTPPAKSIKSELYESVRNALRLASGVRNAEMKWTNPERLDVYGVRLEGWPEGVPAQNPSTLRVNQNKMLLEAMQNGSMKFVKLVPEPNESHDASTSGQTEAANEDFSWAYDADALTTSTSPSPSPGPNPASSTFSKASTVTPVPTTMIDNNDPWALTPSISVEPDEANSSSSYDVNYAWEDSFNEEAVNTLGEDWDDGVILERPRKRQRSEEPPYSGFTE